MVPLWRGNIVSKNMATVLDNESLLVQFKFPLSAFLELSKKVTFMVCQCYCKVSTVPVTSRSLAIALYSASPSIIRVVQYCGIMRFMILCFRHHKMSPNLILNKIVTVLCCMKKAILCDTL